jgi:riboflavin synthase
MFTGIVTDIGEITALTPQTEGKLHRLRIATTYDPKTIAIGASIACSGVCLTAVATGANYFEVDAAAETLALTTARDWRVGTRLNLERALKVGDELGGHIVLGHVDGIARITVRENLPGMAQFTLRAPHELSRFIAQKGSVCLDGVSLTVNSVEDDCFSVLIIPHTLDVTALGGWEMGHNVNLEVDQLARYAARLSEAQ